MAGIHFDITGDNSHFVKMMNEVQASVRQTSSVINSLSRTFDMSGAVQQMVSLTRAIEENEAILRRRKERINQLMDNSIEARNNQDYTTFNTLQGIIESEIKTFEKLNAETEKYRDALDEIKTLNGLMGGTQAPMLFNSQEEYDKVEKLKGQIESLKSEIANFDGSDAEFMKLKGNLTELEEQLKKDETAAANNAKALGEAGELAAAASTRYYELTNAIRDQQAAIGLLTVQTNQAKAAYDAIKATGDPFDIDEARVKWQLYSDKLQSAKMDLINMQTEQRNLQSTMQSVGESISEEGEKILGVFKNIAAAAGIGFGLNQVKDFIGKVVDMRAYFQDIESSMKVFLGSEEKGAEFTERLKDAAYYNMFEFKDLALASQQMIAYGHDVDSIIPRIQQLSDVAVGTQGSLMEMVEAYNRAKSTGVVDGRAIQSWAVKGVMIRDVLREMGEQATGTQITFEQLNKVLDHVTGEGGMFHNLQLNMMENISAELGQFEDNFNNMLDEIGQKFQKEIVSGIKFGSEVIDNYKEIGSLLMDAVAAYGAYRVALVAVSAAHKVNVFWETAEATATKINTAAKLGTVPATTTASVALRTLTTSLAANTTSVLANTAAWLTNPYVLIGAAVAGLTFAVWKLVTAEDAETAARRRANEEMEEFKTQLEDRKNRINSYINVLHDETATEVKQIEAWRALKDEAPSLVEGYTMAEFAAKTLDETQKEVNKDSDKFDLEHARQEVDKWRKEVELANKTKIEPVSESTVIGKDFWNQKSAVDIRTAQTRLKEAEEYLKKLESIQEESNKISLGSLDFKQLFSGYKDAADDINETPIEPKVIEDSLKDAIGTANGLQNDLLSIDTEKITVDLEGDSIKDIDYLTGDLAEKLQEIDLSKTSLYVDREELEKARDEALGAISELQTLDSSVADPDVKKEKIEEAEEKLRSAITKMDDLKNAKAFPEVGIPGIDNVIEKLKTAWGYLAKLMGQKEEEGTPQGSEKPKNKSTKKDFKAEIQKRINEANSDTEVDAILSEVSSALKNSEYGSADRKYYKGLQDQLNNKKKKNAFTTDKQAAKTAKEQAEQNAKELQQQWKHEQEMTDLELKAARAREDASIAAIRNQAVRERKEREVQYNRTIEDLKRQEDDVYRKIYDQRKQAYETANKGKKYENDALGGQGWKGVRGTLTEEEQSYYDKSMAITRSNIKKTEEEWNRSIVDRQKQEIQQLRDYLKEYGTFQQKKLAIAQEYAEKIKRAQEAGNTVEVMRLQAEQRKAEGNAKAQELARGIDFSQMFEGVGTIVKTIAEETYNRVKEYKKTDEYKSSSAESKKAIAELEARLIERGGAGTASPFSAKTWDAITESAKKYDAALKNLQEKTVAHTKAVEDSIRAQEEYDNEPASAEKQYALMMAKAEEQRTANEQQQASGEVESAGQDVQNASAAATKGLQDFNTVLQQISGGSLSGFVNGVSNVISLLTKKTSDDMEGLVGIIGEKAGGIIGAILSVIDMLGDNPTEVIDGILDGIAKVVEAVIAQIPEIVASVVSGAGNIVGGIFRGLGGLFGSIFGIGGVDNSAYEDAIEKWQWVLDSWKETIDYQKELMEKAYGVDAIKVNEEMTETLKKTHQALVDVAKGWLKSGAGLFSHSNLYNVNEGVRWEYLDNQYRRTLNGSVEGLFDMDWKTLETIKQTNQQFWESIHSNVREYIDQIIEAGKAAEEAEKSFMQKMTTTTEDNMFESFLNQLNDLANGSKDVFDNIADDWQKMINKMLVNNIIGSEFQERIGQLYKQLSDAMKKRSNGGTNKEYKDAIDGIMTTYDAYVKQAQEEIEELRKIGLIAATGDNAEQSASVQAMERITMDQADELIGRMNAGQMIWQQGNDQRAIIIAGLTAMQDIVRATGGQFSELVSLQQTANGHLDDIKFYSKKLYDTFVDRMDDIIIQIKNKD